MMVGLVAPLAVMARCAGALARKRARAKASAGCRVWRVTARWAPPVDPGARRLARAGQGGPGPAAPRGSPPGQRGQAHLALHGRAGALEEIGGVGPAPEEDRLAVAEGPPRAFLVRRRHPRRARARLDELSQPVEHLLGARRVGKHAITLVEQAGTRRPQSFQHVDHEPLVLLALPEIALELRIFLASTDDAD